MSVSLSDVDGICKGTHFNTKSRRLFFGIFTEASFSSYVYRNNAEQKSMAKRKHRPLGKIK